MVKNRGKSPKNLKKPEKTNNFKIEPKTGKWQKLPIKIKIFRMWMP